MVLAQYLFGLDSRYSLTYINEVKYQDVVFRLEDVKNEPSSYVCTAYSEHNVSENNLYNAMLEYLTYSFPNGNLYIKEKVFFNPDFQIKELTWGTLLERLKFFKEANKDANVRFNFGGTDFTDTKYLGSCVVTVDNPKFGEMQVLTPNFPNAVRKCSISNLYVKIDVCVSDNDRDKVIYLSDFNGNLHKVCGVCMFDGDLILLNAYNNGLPVNWNSIIF